MLGSIGAGRLAAGLVELAVNGPAPMLPNVHGSELEDEKKFPQPSGCYTPGPPFPLLFKVSSKIPFSDAPPDRTSDHAMGDNHVSTLPSQPLDTPARLNSGASLARLPSVWADDTLVNQKLCRRVLRQSLSATSRMHSFGRVAGVTHGE